MRIDKSIFKYIEHELYSYVDTKKELKAYKDDILHSTAHSDIPDKNIGKPTENKVIKLTTTAYIMHAERIINAIDNTLARLSKNHKLLFELKYCKCLPWQEVSLELGISDRQYFRLRRELVLEVGMNIGVIGL